MQKPVLVLKNMQMVANQDGSVGMQYGIGSGGGSKNSSAQNLTNRLFAPKGQGRGVWDRTKAGFGLAGKGLAGLGALATGMESLASASQNNSLTGALNAPTGMMMTYQGMDPYNYLNAPSPMPKQGSLPMPGETTDDFKARLQQERNQAVQNAAPTYEGPAIANTESPDVGLATYEAKPSVMEAYHLAQEKQPPEPVAVAEPVAEPVAETDVMADFHRRQQERYNLDPSDPRYLPPGKTTAAMDATAPAPAPVVAGPPPEEHDKIYEGAQAGHGATTSTHTATPEPAPAEPTASQQPGSVGQMVGVSENLKTPVETPDAAVDPADVEAYQELQTTPLGQRGAYTNPDSTFTEAPTTVEQPQVDEFGNPLDMFERNALDRMNVQATPQYQIGADRSGEAPMSERQAMVAVREPGQNYAQPQVRTTPQGEELFPTEMSDEVDWSQTPESMSQQAADPWAIRAGFVPAFMEVYGDLLKDMTPHEVGSFASEVFLKMR